MRLFVTTKWFVRCGFLGVATFAALSIFATSATQNPACAQTFFEGENRCTAVDPVTCPFGTRRQGEDSKLLVNFDPDHACIPIASQFCAILTDSAVIGHAADSKQYCVGTPKPAVGTCDKKTQIRENVGPLGFDAFQYFFVNPGSTDAKRVRDALDGIFEDATYYYGMTVNGHEIGCVEVEENGSEVTRIWVPRLDDRYNPSGAVRLTTSKISSVINKSTGGVLESLISDSDRISEEYDKTNIRRIYNAVAFGVVVTREDADPKFCENPNDIYVRQDNDAEICYTGIGDRPCVIPDVRGGGGTDFCVSDIDRSAAIAAGDPVIFTYKADPSDPFHKYVSRVDRSNSAFNFCKQNSKDLLEASTAKGCSDFTEFSEQNLVQILGTRATQEALKTFGSSSDEYKDAKADQDRNQDKYDQCVKCLYSTDNYNDENFRFNFSDPTTFPKLANGTAPSKGSKITPDNEYFAKPLQGRIYNDLACVNVSESTSIVNTVLRISLGIMGLLVVIRLMMGVLQMQQVMKTDPEAVQEGRDVIVSALLALLLLIFSVALLNFLGINVLQLGDQGFNPF